MISLKNSLVSLVVSTQMPSSRQDMHQLLCIPASLPDVHSLIEQIPIYGVLGEQRQMEPGMQALHKEHK